jgi:hypothetical protein
MCEVHPDANLRNPVSQRALSNSECWSMEPQDFVIQLALMSGRHVQVRSMYRMYGWLECVMVCHSQDRPAGFHEVAAEVGPKGEIRVHGGNRITSVSSVGGMIDLFARHAGNAVKWNFF